MAGETKTNERISAPDTVLYGSGLHEGALPGEKRHYWGILHLLVETLVQTAASANDMETSQAKAALATWSKQLSNDAGIFAQRDVEQLLKKHGVAETLEELWAWKKSLPQY